MADYISREAVIKAAKCHYPKANEMIAGIILVPAADVVARDCYDRILAENDTMRNQLAEVGKKIGDTMDDVRPVVRGKWKKRMEEKETPYYKSFTPIWSCSECGTEYDPSLCMTINFCPTCGADMRDANLDATKGLDD